MPYKIFTLVQIEDDNVVERLVLSWTMHPKADSPQWEVPLDRIKSRVGGEDKED